jgi:hypothetical protein
VSRSKRNQPAGPLPATEPATEPALAAEATQPITPAPITPAPDPAPEPDHQLVIVPPPDRTLDPEHDTAMKPLTERRPSNRLVAFLISRRLWFVILLGLLLTAAIEIPWYFWYRAPELDFKIGIMDKTVPFADFRGHRALHWLLMQNKFVDLSQPGNHRWYDFSADYYGYKPIDPPLKWNTSLMRQDRVETRDLLFIADSYGVYQADYTQFPGENAAATIFSPEIYGGMTSAELSAIEWFVGQGRPLIAEFNTFASPTDPEIRAALEDILGVRWSNWVGRYFVDFSDEKDVPQWLESRYQAKYGKTWDITGSGFILYDNEGDDIIVLEDGTDVQPQGLDLTPRREYMNNDILQGVKPSTFVNWFDIVEPQAGTEVLMDYHLNVTKSGEFKLEQHGLKDSFPAVMRVQRNYRAYYLAGDMVNYSGPMGPPNTRLTMYINRSFNRHEVAGSPGYYYWYTYYPLMSNILRYEMCEQKGRPDNVYIFKNK